MPSRTKPPKPKESPAEQHKRFVELAKEVEASEKPEDFDKAFKRVTTLPRPKK